MWSFRRLSIWSEPRKLSLRSFSVPRRDQMNSHKNAPLTPRRLVLPANRSLTPVDGGWSILWRDEDADRWAWFIPAKLELNTKSLHRPSRDRTCSLSVDSTGGERLVP